MDNIHKNIIFNNFFLLVSSEQLKQYYNLVQEMQYQTSPRNAQNQENLSCQIKLRRNKYSVRVFNSRNTFNKFLGTYNIDELFFIDIINL